MKRFKDSRNKWLLKWSKAATSKPVHSHKIQSKEAANYRATTRSNSRSNHSSWCLQYCHHKEWIHFRALTNWRALRRTRTLQKALWYTAAHHRAQIKASNRYTAIRVVHLCTRVNSCILLNISGVSILTLKPTSANLTFSTIGILWIISRLLRCPSRLRRRLKSWRRQGRARNSSFEMKM